MPMLFVNYETDHGPKMFLTQDGDGLGMLWLPAALIVGTDCGDSIRNVIARTVY